MTPRTKDFLDVAGVGGAEVGVGGTEAVAPGADVVALVSRTCTAADL